MIKLLNELKIFLCFVICSACVFFLVYEASGCFESHGIPAWFGYVIASLMEIVCIFFAGCYLVNNFSTDFLFPVITPFDLRDDDTSFSQTQFQPSGASYSETKTV